MTIRLCPPACIWWIVICDAFCIIFMVGVWSRCTWLVIRVSFNWNFHFRLSSCYPSRSLTMAILQRRSINEMKMNSGVQHNVLCVSASACASDCVHKNSSTRTHSATIEGWKINLSMMAFQENYACASCNRVEVDSTCVINGYHSTLHKHFRNGRKQWQLRNCFSILQFHMNLVESCSSSLSHSLALSLSVLSSLPAPSLFRHPLFIRRPCSTLHQKLLQNVHFTCQWCMWQAK